jgi:hypothetical protein
MWVRFGTGSLTTSFDVLVLKFTKKENFSALCNSKQSAATAPRIRNLTGTPLRVYAAHSKFCLKYRSILIGYLTLLKIHHWRVEWPLVKGFEIQRRERTGTAVSCAGCDKN